MENPEENWPKTVLKTAPPRPLSRSFFILFFIIFNAFGSSISLAKSTSLRIIHGDIILEKNAGIFFAHSANYDQCIDLISTSYIKFLFEKYKNGAVKMRIFANKSKIFVHSGTGNSIEINEGLSSSPWILFRGEQIFLRCGESAVYRARRVIELP